MAESDLITFELQYETWRKDREIEKFVGDRVFEFFCAEQFLKHKQLNDEELRIGQVDRSDDGGIDGFYCFFNGVLLNEDTVIDDRSTGEFEIKLFQCKSGSGFSYSAIDKVTTFVDDLLSFHRPDSEYNYKYHEDLMNLIRLFKAQYNQINARTSPKLSIEFFYATKLDVEDPEINALKAADRFVAAAEAKVADITVFPIRFIGVRKLLLQYRIAEPQIRFLRTKKNFGADGGWVVLAALSDYCEFLRHPQLTADGHPQIDESIFDANVRGYNRDSKVNKRITATLENEETEFWQLNNGITVITPKDSDIQANDNLKIHNPQIVNGLQTSRRIFDYYRNRGFSFPPNDSRRILIRVINTGEDQDVRSQIIRATNDQNTMPAEAFLSTMQIQQKIEMYFLSKGLFYDRRKGHYKSLNKPAHQIVDILELIQSLVAIVRKEPHISRGAPRSYLDEKKRQTIFGADDDDIGNRKDALPLEVYLRSIQIMRRVGSYLTSIGKDKPTVKNLQSYVALDATTAALGNAHYPGEWVSRVDLDTDLTDDLIKLSYERVDKIYQARGHNDATAKSKPMADELKNELKRLFSPKKKR